MPIKGFESTYSVSEFGNVKRLGKDKLCKPYLRNGYLSVGLSQSNKVRSFHIHRLVAEAFIPNPENLPTVNHLNAIKTDNHVWNLEWCSRSEQLKHAVRMGVFNPIPPTKKGDKLSIETRKKMSLSQLRRYNKQQPPQKSKPSTPTVSPNELDPSSGQ